MQYVDDVVNSPAIVGTIEIHEGAKKRGHDQFVCAPFKKVVAHAHGYVEVRNGKSMRG